MKRRIFIWGTQYAAERCMRYINLDKCEVLGFVETVPKKSVFFGRKVISPDSLKEYIYDYIVVANLHFKEIRNTIKERNIPGKAISWLYFEKDNCRYGREVFEMFNHVLPEHIIKDAYFDESLLPYYRSEISKIDQADRVYVYNLKLHKGEIAVNRVVAEIISVAREKKQLLMLFIPDDDNVQVEWYHNLLVVLSRHHLVAWPEQKAFFSYVFDKYKNKVAYGRFNRLAVQKEGDQYLQRSRYFPHGRSLLTAEIIQEKIEKAKRVNVYPIQTTRIGEYIRRVNIANELNEISLARGELNVYVPADEFDNYTEGANPCLVELVARKHDYIRCKEELYIWIDNILKCPKKFRIARFKLKNPRKIYTNEIYHAIIDFTDEELKAGRKVIEQIFGLHDDYVCTFTRDASYLSSTYENHDFSYHDYRDIPFSTMGQAIQYLEKRGLASIRMGQIIEKNSDVPLNYMTFANICYDPYLDLMLHRHCKFTVGTTSGIVELTRLYGMPLAEAGIVYPIIDPFFVYKKEDIYIFQRLRRTDNLEELSFREIFEIYYRFQVEYSYDYSFIRGMGLETVPFTQEDFLDIAIEMDQRVDGIWADDEDDEKLRNRFAVILHEFLEEKGVDENLYQQWPIATTFLRRYRRLLIDKNEA